MINPILDIYFYDAWLWLGKFSKMIKTVVNLRVPITVIYLLGKI